MWKLQRSLLELHCAVGGDQQPIGRQQREHCCVSVFWPSLWCEWVSDEIRERDCVMKRSEICIHKKTTPADCWTAAGNFISNFSASHDAEMASASQKCWAETPTTPSGNHTHPLHHRWTFQQQLFNFKHALINSQLTVLLVRLWCWSSEGGGVRRSGGQQTHGGAGKKN